MPFVVLATVGLIACSSGGDSRSTGGNGGGDSETGGSGGKGGGKAGGSGGTTSSNTGTKLTGGTSGGTGGAAGGTGGTISGGTAGTSSGGSGGTATGGTATGGTAGTAAGTGGAATGGTMGGGGVTGVPFGPAQPMFTGDAGPYQKPDAIGIIAGSPLNYIGLDLYGGGCCFGGADGGDWAYYEEVDFGKHCAYDKLIISYASPMMGGRMRVKLDNPQGPTVGEITFAATGTDYSTVKDVTMTIAPVSGKHFLVMQFIGSFGIGNFGGFILDTTETRKACPAAQ